MSLFFACIFDWKDNLEVFNSNGHWFLWFIPMQEEILHPVSWYT